MQNVPRARVKGPLAPLADGFRTELDRLGYTDLSREFKINPVSYTHLRAHETVLDLVCRLLLEKKK